ncbi:MAG: ABC transporter permease [Myxococcota bacterium]|nr:ABC transporter permease [Myxococcota bacterium]
MTKLSIILRLTLRNIFARKINFLIGALVFAGTLLLVVGGSIVASVDEGMRRSITGSVSGDLQVFSARSRDAISIFGGIGGEPDMVSIEDFPRVKAALLSLENVQAVVPMGINGSLFTPGTALDLALGGVRDLLRERADGAPTAEWTRSYEKAKRRVRYIVGRLDGYAERSASYLSPEVLAEDTANLERAGSEAFWAEFQRDPLAALDFLENRVAPLVGDSLVADIRFLGTDLEAFQETFDRMEQVKGEPIPPGRRGFLFADWYYEERMKLQVARRLDKIQRALANGSILAEDTELQGFVQQNRDEVSELLLQLDPESALEIAAALRTALNSEEQELPRLFDAFLSTTDANFAERYRLFYEVVAPRVSLYRVRIGDMLKVTAHTRTGYISSASMKVYGTYQFKGLEDSELAGSLNLVDLVTFGELYGYATPDQKEELQALRANSGVEFISREGAEDALFGGPAEGPVEHESMSFVLDLDAEEIARRRTAALTQTVTRDQLERGVVLSAAVVLKDADELPQTLQAIATLNDRERLGIQTLAWREAAGMVGHFTSVVKVILYFCAAMVLLVTAIVISNVVTIATLRRIREFGTLRAIGAHRPLVLTIVLTESIAVGVAFALLGGAVGVGILVWLGTVGIPGGGDLSLFFAGPRLFPTVSSGALLVALAVTVVVSASSSLFPAVLASRVTPLRAMQTED